MSRPRSRDARPPVPEREVDAQVVEAALMLGIVLERQNVMVARNPKGQPVACGKKGDEDRKALLPGGRALFVEIKRPGEKPTAEQYARMEEHNRAGAVAFWTDDPEHFLFVMRYVLKGASVVCAPDGIHDIVLASGQAG